ncbi:MAG: c-type cytochrome [Caldilineaceae bacterium]|nr:c-type cytochrome [Caldilineaceae bacterium]
MHWLRSTNQKNAQECSDWGCSVWRTRRWLGIGVLVIVLFSTQAAYAQQPSPTFDLSQVPTPVSPPFALAGQAIYQESCAPCHGMEGLGDGPTSPQLPSPATVFANPDAIWERSPAQLFHTTKFGRIENLMPPWQNQLDDTQIWQAVAYAWSLHTSQTETDAGAALYAQSCANCHGPQGAGDGPAAPPNLVDFTDRGYAMARSQADWLAGWQTAHADLGADWSIEEQRQVLETIRSFSYTPPWQSAYQAGSGIITGTVTQGTPGGIAVAGLTATLEAYVSFTPIASFTTTVDSRGVFTFTEVSTDPSINYVVVVAAEALNYTSPLLTFAPDQTALQTQLAIYGTTTDGSTVRIDQLHWIIDSRPGIVVMGEIFTFSNTGDRTFTGTTVDGVAVPVTVAFRVPADAQEVSFENGIIGGRFQQVGDMVYDTMPVVPGQRTRQIIMRYFVPVANESANFTQEFLYPIDQMTVLVTELPELEVAVPGFTLARRENLQGQNYQLWQPEGGVPAGVTVQLMGLLQEGDTDPRAVESGTAPVGTSTSSVVPLLEPWAPWAVGAAVVVGLISVAGWAWQQQRTGRRSPRQELQAQQNLLILQIADLDDQYGVQAVADAHWQQERAHLKAQLLQITTRLEESA